MAVSLLSFFLGNISSLHIISISLHFSSVQFDLGLLVCLCIFSFLAILICENAQRSRGFDRKHHLLRKLLYSSCTEMLNLDLKDRLRYQDPVVELSQLKKQSRCSVPFWGVQAWSTSNVLPILGIALCGVLFR